MMDWIYLSPHLDDVALSCGGLVWEQSHSGSQVSVWTLCAGDPPKGVLSPFAASLHERWKTGEEAAGQRRLEDQAACARLGAFFRHFPLPDCIYRQSGNNGRYLYASEEAIFGPIDPQEAPLVRSLSSDLAQALPASTQVVCPLSLGGHVDHRLVRAAAELLQRPLWYYPDYPYVLKAADQLTQLTRSGWETVLFSVSEDGLQAWEQAVAAYTSQISSFWENLEQMRAAIRAYGCQNGGLQLLRPPASNLAFSLQNLHSL